MSNHELITELRRRPSLDTYDSSVAFEVIADNFVPGDPNCLVSAEAVRAGKQARAKLLGRGVPPDAIEGMFYDAGQEVRELRAWLSVVTPEDFSDPHKWL